MLSKIHNAMIRAVDIAILTKDCVSLTLKLDKYTSIERNLKEDGDPQSELDSIECKILYTSGVLSLTKDALISKVLGG